MKDVKLPPVLQAIIDDLRSSKMLPVAVVMIVAVVLVPVALLSTGGEDAAPAGPAPSASQALPPEVQAAVLVDSEGIRNYRKRLGEFDPTNPFKQRYTRPPGGGEQVEDSTADEPASSTSTTTTTSGGSGSDVPSAPSTTVPTPDDKDGDGLILFEYKITYKYGEAGGEKEIKTTRQGDPVVKKNPLAYFLGSNGTQALFVATGAVYQVDSDGSCLPSKQQCYETRIELGDKVKFFRTSDDKVFIVKLLEMELVEARAEKQDDVK